MSQQREFDIVLYGATGFTGQLSAQYFANYAPTQIKWALGGRSLSKLEAVRAQLGPTFADTPIILADSQDADALNTLCQRTQVVLSTVGPYAKYGEPLVKACIEQGTDYVDITGETVWIRTLIDKYHEQALAKGVKIVHCCGIDSLPSDMMTYLLAREAQEQLGQDLISIKGLFQFRGGGLNGGTLASILNMAESKQLDQMSKPYLLNPIEEQSWTQPKDQKSIAWDSDLWVWTAPFMMAPTNTRIVRRSEALYRQAGQAYGPEFIYDEAMWFDEFLPTTSLTVAGTLLLGAELMRLAPVRRLLKQVGPQAGQGPSEAIMNRSAVSAWFHGKSVQGEKIKGHFFCHGDPGNKVTVKLLCESALCLILNRNDLPTTYAGGILTPALALGDPLIERLRAVGVTMECHFSS